VVAEEAEVAVASSAVVVASSAVAAAEEPSVVVVVEPSFVVAWALPLLTLLIIPIELF
jgi:hypothetical protein